MNDEEIKIIKQAVYEVNRKYEQEAIYEAYEKSKKEGIKEGIKKGRIEGIKEGRIEGRKKVQEDVTKKLKGIISPEEISKVTGLSLNRVLEILDLN